MWILIRWLTTPLLLMTPVDITVGIVELILIRCILESIKLRKEIKNSDNKRKNRLY